MQRTKEGDTDERTGEKEKESNSCAEHVYDVLERQRTMDIPQVRQLWIGADA